MKPVYGNVTADIQVSTQTVNDIGERVPAWETVQTLTGWIDYQSGDAVYTNYAADIQESTHVFVCDYVPLDPRIRPDSARLVCNGQPYDITLIDDPMELHYHYEIFLKRVGTE